MCYGVSRKVNLGKNPHSELVLTASVPSKTRSTAMCLMTDWAPKAGRDVERTRFAGKKTRHRRRHSSSRAESARGGGFSKNAPPANYSPLGFRDRAPFVPYWHNRHCLDKEDPNMNVIHKIGLAATVVGALALTGCSGVVDTGTVDGAAAENCERSTEKVIYFDYPLTSLSVYGDLQRFAEAAAAERGYEVKYTADDNDLQKQNTNVQALVTQKVPAVVSYPLEPTSMESLAAEAMSNCTVWVSYAAPLKNQDANVLFSGFESGAALGEAAKAWAAEQPGPVKVLILQDRDLAVGAERDDGLNSTFPGDASNIEIVATQKASDRTQGEQVTREILQAHPDLNMVLSYNDDAGLGARQAFINAGKDAKDPSIFIGGQDGSKEGLSAVAEDGLYRVSVAVRIKDIGEAVANVPIDILEGATTEGINVPPVAITIDSPDLAAYLGDYS